jgi:hypothetical protein
MWRGPVAREAEPQNLELLCYPACCAALAVAGNSKLSTVAREGEYRDTLVEAIEEIVVRERV